MKRIWTLLPIVLSLGAGLFLSFGLWEKPFTISFEPSALAYDAQGFTVALHDFDAQLLRLKSETERFHDEAKEQALAYAQQKERLDKLAQETVSSRHQSDDMYEERIVSLLGKPIGTSSSSYARIKVFDFQKIEYRGYVAKVTPKKDKALDVVRSEEGKVESTLRAYERSGAQLAVNGGGFFSNKKDGKNLFFAMGNTVINSQLQNEFAPTYKDITFIGFKKNGTLIGGQFETEADLMATHPYAGCSFVPPLIINKEKVDIPSQWANARQPRTIVGEYPNKDILLIVIDGRQSEWSKGVTLEEAQDVLLQLGLHTAYNLDGGGSTSMVFKGKTLNRPSDGRARSVVTNIIVR